MSSCYQVREAHEEVGLPTPSEDFQILGLFPPHPFHKLVVTPVLAYTPKPDAVLSQLKASEAEVEHIFSHPLEAFIDPPLASKYGTELVERGGSDWTFEEEFHVRPSVHLAISACGAIECNTRSQSRY